MYFAKSAFVVSLLALCRVAVAADPPSCLLAAIGTESNPADLASLCGSASSAVQSQISQSCGDDTQTAMTFYSNTCASAGHQVVLNSSVSSASSTTSDATTTASGSSKTGFVTIVTTTATSGSSGSSSSSSGASSSSSAHSPSSTGAASSNKQVSAAAFAAVVFVSFAAAM
ncbi:uncharacterized protein CDV56_104976 [Aspergillus thermomutatus]|uniref:Extracellular membrane protein CFEM domain-containing protein n=1 Tax=Aspergillus thermomutatus TaxID=41047 RepID=A0A397G878_ASPTH|nr:uncharacterized protein CDV56_104976 [Aspergillus thermomutatus]RHZ47232.1 hypothetical protein CDV56_104976 [Aspergillus thermomutatus]